MVSWFQGDMCLVCGFIFGIYVEYDVTYIESPLHDLGT